MAPSLKLLVIEDDPDDAFFIQRYLHDSDPLSTNFKVDCADRLAGGMEMLREQSYDAVLLDLMLPDSQGIQTFLKLNSQGHNLPVLILTGLEDVALTMEAIRLGAQDYLIKGSLDGRVLRRAIRYAIERKKFFNQTENIIKYSADGMVVVDKNGLIRYVNPAAKLILGMEEKELLSQPFPFPLRPGEPRTFKIPKEGKAADRDTKTIEMRVSEIDWRETPAFLASLRDISELIRLEQLRAEVKERRRMDQLKDNLLNSVSHELRTPLMIAKGAIENLTDGIAGSVPEPLKKTIDMAHRNIGRLAKLINNMLDLSRLESGKAKVNLGPVSLAALIDEKVQEFNIAARGRNIVIEQDFPKNLTVIQADSEMISQVLGNLLDNALRFATRKVAVRAETSELAAAQAGPRKLEYGKAGDRNGKGIHVTVMDDGAGIPGDRIKDLFDKFVQVNRAVGGSGYKGTGLGLAICKEIIELHHGEIWADSSPGGGAEFHFVLPEVPNDT